VKSTGPGVGRGQATRVEHLGNIEIPRPGDPATRESLRVIGYGLFRRGSVNRVDVLIDGHHAGNARLGLPSPDLRNSPALGKNPAASVSGFEWLAGPADLPDEPDRVTLEVLVTSTEGETFRMSRDLWLSPPEPRFEDTLGYAAHRRHEVDEIVLCRSSPKGEGVRLLAFTHRLDHGGAQRYFFEQIRYLMRDPHLRCTVVAPLDGFWRRRLETIGVEVHLTGYPVAGVTEYESAVAQLAAWMTHHRFDAVYVNTLDSFIGADVADRLGLPVMWKIHESFLLPNWWVVAHGGARHPYVFERLEKALSRASALIFAADATKRLFEPYAAPSRMVTAPYGLELHDIDTFRERCEPARLERLRSAYPEDALLILCLGTVNARKAQAVLAQAFAQVATKHPNAHLVLVGDQGGSYSTGIQRYVKDAGLKKRCHLIPVTSDAYFWHEVADIFVLSSDIESSPISILEAMAFETPVIASRVFGVPELIEDGRNGYLCEPNDVIDLARCLDRVLSARPEERRRVAQAGASRVRRRHDPDRYARSLRRLLQQLVQDADATPSWEDEPPSPSAGALEALKHT